MKSTTKRYEALDGWRGLAALLVVVHHFKTANTFSDSVFVGNFAMMVDLFFVLSGFVISLSSIDKLQSFHDCKSFMIKRFARIYPLHLVTLLALVPFALVYSLILNQGGDRFSLFSFISNVFLIDPLNLFDAPTWNMPSWSIAVEFFAYLFFSIILFFNLRKRIRFFTLLSLVSIMLLFVFSDKFMKDTSSYSLFRCFTGFFMGCAIYSIKEKLDTKVLGSVFYRNVIFVSEWILLILLIFILINKANLIMFFLPLFFGLLVFIYSYELGHISKLLRLDFFQKLGLWSFSIYMIHSVIFLSIKGLSIVTDKILQIGWYDQSRNIFDFGSDFVNGLSYFIALSVVIVLSRFTYIYIELPAQSCVKRKCL
jgi:peptidoglycan/LPS O-acetylase OafA/YrhL